jgi:hypothetical protein
VIEAYPPAIGKERMDNKGAGLIAGAILIVGSFWVYWAEIRPAQLGEECSFKVLSSYVSESDKDKAVAVDLCSKAGGWEKMWAAYQIYNETFSGNAEEAVPVKLGAASEAVE